MKRKPSKTITCLITCPFKIRYKLLYHILLDLEMKEFAQEVSPILTLVQSEQNNGKHCSKKRQGNWHGGDSQPLGNSDVV